MAEAFAYLQREGLVVVPFPPELHNYMDKSRVYFMLSRAGASIELPAGLEQHQHAQLLPKELLHSSLMGTVLPLFQRRAYETAVFAAMKQVEVAVRAVSQLPENLVGTALMRKAFLADQRLGRGFAIEAERQALCGGHGLLPQQHWTSHRGLRAIGSGASYPFRKRTPQHGGRT